MPTITIYDDSDGEEVKLSNQLIPEEALITMAIMRDNRVSDLRTQEVRNEYWSKIIYSTDKSEARLSNLWVKCNISTGNDVPL